MKPLPASLTLFGLIALAAIAFAFSGYSWAGWGRATCFPNCFCEAPFPGPIVQPSNTYSNLGYILIGLLILRHRIAGDHNPLRANRAYSTLYGAAVVATGGGSLFYHASLTWLGQWFDWFGMFLFISFLLLYNLRRLLSFNNLTFAIAYALINVALGIVSALYPAIRVCTFTGFVYAGLAAETLVLLFRRPKNQIVYLLAGLGCFGLAYWIWILDRNRILCDPGSWLQGHAVWHLLTALSTGFIYLYYHSEHERRPT